MTNERVCSKTKEINVPAENILRNILRSGENLSNRAIFEAVPVNEDSLPVFASGYYHANIGHGRPELLELRFVKTDHDFFIALLMTNERSHKDLEIMSSRIIQKVEKRGISFNAVVAPASLGMPLAQEIARQVDPSMSILTLQKGKATIGEDGLTMIGPPKAWVPEDHGIKVNSGTSHSDVSQKLYLDPKVAELSRKLNLEVLFVDDARLTAGTINASMELLDRLGINVICVSTVLNESDLADTLGPKNIPYEYLVKIPVFKGEIGNLTPIKGSFEGVKEFYIEKPI